MKEIKRLVIVLITAAFFIGYFFINDYYAKQAKDYYAYQPASTDFTAGEESLIDYVYQYASTLQRWETKITAVGDLMFYMSQLEYAYDQESESFDFSSSFQYISKYFASSSYVIGNLETNLAGKDQGTYTDIYGYGANVDNLNFNTPESIASDLKNAGFSMMITANNKALNNGFNGLTATLSNIKSAGLTPLGTRAASSDVKYHTETISGIKFAFTAYTNSLDDSLGEDNTFAVNYLDNYSTEKITEMCNEVSSLKDTDVDLVVVYLHFGDRYASAPDDQQKEIVNKLAQAGADLILGSNPHVLQPVDVIDTMKDDGTYHRTVVAYSLGNFISAQQYQSDNGYNRDIGLIFDAVVAKTDNDVSISEIHLTPTYVNWDDDNKTIAVIPVCEVYDNMDNYNSVLSADAKARIETAYKDTIEFLTKDSGLSYTYSDYKYKIILEN